VIREGLAVLLGTHPVRAVVVGTSGQVVPTTADVAVYDLARLDSGIAAGDLLRLARRTPVVGFVRADLGHLEATAHVFGVRRVVPEDVTVEPLLVALEHAVLQGPSAKDRRVLNDRELDTLRQIGAGLSNRQIADALILSINTVKTDVRGAYRKLGVTSRTEAMTWCIQHGLIAPLQKDPHGRHAASMARLRAGNRPDPP
jgi:DNA-binding NarL/FixJ family response regulator